MNQQIELTERVSRMALTDGNHPSAIPGVSVVRASATSPVRPSLYQPSLCIVVQGRKRTIRANEEYLYDSLNYLVVSLTLALKSQVIEASPASPYLCLRIALDRKVISDLLLQAGPSLVVQPPDDHPIFVGRTNEPLLDALVRLTRLQDEPRHAAVLAPLVLREIQYRLLIGELGYRLREVFVAESNAQRIDSAIQMLIQRYAEPLRIEDLAAAAHMSESSLHHRFKEITAMSPVQFQKQLRLHEARRLMLAESMDASAAARRVGYESASQFSREYRRMFGAPPRREIDLVRHRA